MDHIFIDKNRGIVELHLASHDVSIDGNIAVEYKANHDNLSSPTKEVSKSKPLITIVLMTVAIITLLGAITFTLWQWYAGGSTPDFVSISAKLFSVALIGSLISLGGINIFSLKGELNALHQKIEKATGCPFVPIFRESDNNVHNKYRPGNPRVCLKCPLGIDGVSNLIHNCKAYDHLNQLWQKSQ